VAAHRRSLALAVPLALALFQARSAPPPLTYRGGAQGTVIFDHQLHARRGWTCRDCHTVFKSTGRQLFQTRKQGRITWDDHEGPTRCFACHDGQAAFDACGQCHRSP
jgi:c(7)-type cytochrome triheme protein